MDGKKLCRGCGRRPDLCHCDVTKKGGRRLKWGTRPCPSCTSTIAAIIDAGEPPESQRSRYPKLDPKPHRIRRPRRNVMWFIRWALVWFVGGYVPLAYLRYRFTNPDLTETELFLSFWQAITWQ